MSKVALIKFLPKSHSRYGYVSPDFSDSSRALLTPAIFGEVLSIYNGDPEYESSDGAEFFFDLKKSLNIYKSLNTFGTSVSPEEVSLPDKSNTYALFVKCPDEAKKGWMFIDHIYTDPEEYVHWIDTLLKKGLPPRTPEEIEHDRLKAIEDERIANLRPVEMGDIALIRIMDMSNFSSVILHLDINNTKVKDMRTLAVKVFGGKAADIPMASTNAFTPDKITELTKKSKEHSPTRHDSINRFKSVLDGKKHGYGPAVGVPPETRSTLADNVRLADMKGQVIVYWYNGITKTSFAEQLKELGIDAAIDILFDS